MVTEADEQNDLKSVQRKLDRKLVLVVKQKLGDKDYWCLPQIRWSKGQSMREVRVPFITCENDIASRWLLLISMMPYTPSDGSHYKKKSRSLSLE